MSAPKIAIVIPVFNEEAVLPELFARLDALFAAQPGGRWEAVLVDDGSRDRSAELIRAAAVRDPRFRLVELSRNFGFQSALSAGLARTGEADAAVTMDADLQDPPELIPELVAAWRDRGRHCARHPPLAQRDRAAARRLRSVSLPLRQAHGLPDRAEHRHVRPARARGDRGVQRAARASPVFPGTAGVDRFPDRRCALRPQERAAGQPAAELPPAGRYAMDGLFSFPTCRCGC